VSHDVDLALCYEHVFDIRINFHTRLLFGPVSGGAKQGYTSVGEGCTVAGPRLNGQLLDYGGGDWPVIRTDGVVELNAHYVIVADDGTQIYIHNLGTCEFHSARPTTLLESRRWPLTFAALRISALPKGRTIGSTAP
jgi:hypothetical protein